MKNTIKIMFAALIITMFLPVTANAADNVTIKDGAELLSKSEEADLEKQLSSYNTDKNYLIVTENDYESGYSSMHSEMDFQYNNIYSANEDGIAFIINMKDRQLYMGGFGKCSHELRSGDAVDITDNVYRYAKDGDYYSCLSRAFSEADTILNNGAIFRPLRYIVSILFGFLFGFLIMFFVVIISRTTNRSKTGQPDKISAAVISSAVITGAITGGLINKTVTKHYSSSSSSSSGGGGASSGGGGGSSGGGHGF